MNRIAITLEIVDTGEDLEALPCLFSLEVDGRPVLLLGECARPQGIPSHDASYGTYSLFEATQGLILTLLADHHPVLDPEDPYAAPLFVAECGMDCCGYHDLGIYHRGGAIVVEVPDRGERYTVDPADYAAAVTSAVRGFLQLALGERRLRDDEAWHLYDHLAWLLRRAAHDGPVPIRQVCRRFLDEAEERIQQATQPVQAVQGTH
ncbi:MAG: hypothetical protein N0A24_10165 [Armatimonadetes bacterium]|nr:hypothetical protein [Armatimonadota bacterium]MDW8154539.1 hypothetical protein [Armatimonadota bacterium]